MVYLTYNDAPSGIYSSQVIDVCRFLNTDLNADIRLISLISVRDFSANKKRIRSVLPSAIVLPMFPMPQNWKWNYFLLFFLFLFIGKQSVIARGPFAASLAMGLKKIGFIHKVCFDARGAYYAELNEYDVAKSAQLNKNIFQIEKNVVIHSDFRIAVSNKLVEYWKQKFNYHMNEHVVIPCTLNSVYFEYNKTRQQRDALRSSLGYSPEDIVFVYSGSSAGWQSLKLIDDFLCYLLEGLENAKVLMLIKAIPDNMSVLKKYPERTTAKWVTEAEVADILNSCDYGLLIRESSVTNSVASPVKFAEYLAVGLKVIISSGLGDYSDFVVTHDCGYLAGSFDARDIQRPGPNEKERVAGIAKNIFFKENYTHTYETMYNHIYPHK